MEINKKNTSRTGFSLLELLIYVAILSIVMVAISSSFISVSKGRVKADTQVEVNSNLRFALDKISQDIKGASGISVPATANATSSSLSATSSAVSLNYCVTSGVLRRQSGSACTVSSEAITSDLVRVDSIEFKRIENTHTLLGVTLISIQISMAMSYNSSSSDWQYSASGKTSASLP